MKLSTLKFALTLFVISFALFSCSKDNTGIYLNASTSTEVVAAKTSYTSLETDVLNEVNAYRESIGLSTLKQLDIVSGVSLGHSDYMAKENKLNHDGFDQRVQILMDQAGAQTVAENVAFGYSTAKDVVTAWLNSPEHRAVIENPNFNYFGVATEKNANGNYYFTQMFIRK